MSFRQCFLLILFFFPLSASAKFFSAPILNDAYHLLDTNPEQSLAIAKQYLKQRQISPEQDPNRIQINNDSERTIRTPISTVEAFQIKALANKRLDRNRESIESIKQAISLAKDFNLKSGYLESQLIYASLWWNLTKDADETNAILKIISTKLNEYNKQILLNKKLSFGLALIHAEVESEQGNNSKAQQFYKRAMSHGSALNDPSSMIFYHLSYGRYFLKNKQFDQALTELLSAYWQSIEADRSGQLATVNYLLGQLFFQRQVLDKALEHASQSAEFYGRYNNSEQLSNVLILIAQIHLKQGRFNLALVQYFNALDQEKEKNNVNKLISLRLDIANTYFLLYNYALSEHYLKQANNLNEYVELPKQKAIAALLQAKLDLVQNKTDLAVQQIQSAIKYSQEDNNISLKLQSQKLLSKTYERMGLYEQSLKAQREYETLNSSIQAVQNEINEEVFRQQKSIIEQSLHYQGLEEQLKDNHLQTRKIQKIAGFLLVLLTVLSIYSFRKQQVNRFLKKRLHLLLNKYYTHPRSGLRNFRLLTERLPSSLQQSSSNIEQWHLGELINEPLSDRLRFTLFHVPMLQHLYFTHGYQEGLSIEKEFGDYLSTVVSLPSRIYHFSDASFLYIEHKSDSTCSSQEMAETVQEWINCFESKVITDRTVNIGMVEYPFLPRAYTAINDRELIDILLMATNTACNISSEESGSQWVHYRAIDNAPAASFASNNILLACEQAINQGLIKVTTSKN
ncbi:tetratricopeptide repeat protein [Aliivibrio salmonicida]|uniref:tetratricopeptide repeat protein n=1 Tax=Aliivibrio salmonicida TaxID=40269 RepID=UPI00406C351A